MNPKYTIGTQHRYRFSDVQKTLSTLSMAYEKPDYQNDAIAIERSKRACDQYRRRKIICCGPSNLCSFLRYGERRGGRVTDRFALRGRIRQCIAVNVAKLPELVDQ